MWVSSYLTDKFKKAVISRTLLFTLSGFISFSLGAPGAAATDGKWMSGDFHQHTYYTDGATAFGFVMQKNYEYGLDWWANSEHGGGFSSDGENHCWDDTRFYPANPILGDYSFPKQHQIMWRWQSLRDFVFPDILAGRLNYPDKRIFSGVEWNVPGHDGCSVGILGEDAEAISVFEYKFDAADTDTSRSSESTPLGTFSKRNGKKYTWPNGVKTVTSKSNPGAHTDSVAAAMWMERQYRHGLIDDAWMIFAHVERPGVWKTTRGRGYNVEHFRDYNNAAPHICYGFEGAPGHQANTLRGHYTPSATFGGTYGGVGYHTATVGGLWDALLGEGRRWFSFANSDYHRHYTNCNEVNCGDSFYPGEYQKNWVYVKDLDGDGIYSLKEIAQAMRSGNSFFVMGDLIDYLEFSASRTTKTVNMGEILKIRTTNRIPINLRIKFKSPGLNANADRPCVDHVDLIAGRITGRILPTDPNYTKATNDTTMVIARFTAADWVLDADGNNVIDYPINPTESTYFRLRGTNIPVDTPYETDEKGNPLPDSLATAYLGVDGAAEAWKDLWFYSNPIYVYVVE